MAYSVQAEHGQNERQEGHVLSAIAKDSSKERAKFVPNPAAKPFVPTSNFIISNGPSRSSDASRRADQGPNGGRRINNNVEASLNSSPYGVAAPVNYMNGSYVNGVTEHHPVNGVTPEATGPQTLHSQDHIALLLLSQVLDDESVVNFTNFDESNACFEGMSFPGSASAGQGSNGSSQAWNMKSPLQDATPSNMSLGSFPGQNIWSSRGHPNSTPPLSPLDMSPSSSFNSSFGTTPPLLHPSSMPTGSVDSSNRSSPIVNGYHDDTSPHPSPNSQTFGSSEGTSHSFIPIKDHYKGRSWHSETTHHGNSASGSYPSSHSANASTGHLPFSRKARPTSLNFGEVNGYSYNSSPSMSPSSPRSSFSQSESKHLGFYKLSSPRDSSFGPSPTAKEMAWKENGYSNHGMSPRMRSPLTSELHLRLEECYDQLRLLERERKKAEAEVSRVWSGRRLSNTLNAVNVRLPPNPSRVDKLVVDQFREHAKVEAIVGRIERIRHSPLHVSISENVDMWQNAIRDLQLRRKEEVYNSSTSPRNRPSCSPRHQDGLDLVALVRAVKNVHHHTRLVRTTVWCAVQLVTSNNGHRSGSRGSSEDAISTSPVENDATSEKTS